MSIFTPSAAAGGGGAAAYDGATFTVQSSDPGVLVVEMQLTLGGDPAAVDALVQGALVAIGSVEPHDTMFLQGYNMYVGDGPAFAYVIEAGYIELYLENPTFSVDECRIALALPSGGLAISGVFEVPASTPQ